MGRAPLPALAVLARGAIRLPIGANAILKMKDEAGVLPREEGKGRASLRQHFINRDFGRVPATYAASERLCHGIGRTFPPTGYSSGHLGIRASISRMRRMVWWRAVMVFW